MIPLQSKESTAVHQLEQFICKHLKAPEEKLKVQEVRLYGHLPALNSEWAERCVQHQPCGSITIDTVVPNHALRQAFHERGVGLLLSERLMNCPPAVAPALQSALLEDLEGGQRNVSASFGSHPSGPRDNLLRIILICFGAE